MAFKKRVKRTYGKVRSFGRRHKTAGGVTGDLLSGGIIGAVIQVASPVVNQYVPGVMGLRPTTIATLGGGIAAKTLFHKGGKFADAAVIIGTAMAVGDLMAGMGATASNGAGGFYG